MLFISSAKGFSGRQINVSIIKSCIDFDGDGYGQGCLKGWDCNDNDFERHPDAYEDCDFVDNNCDTLVDEVCSIPEIDPKEVIKIPAGKFIMGSPQGIGSRDEHPSHIVQLDGFAIDRFEVTNGRYAECVAAGYCTPPASSSSVLRKSYYNNYDFTDYPVIEVNWYQATEFCNWAGGRLPTEAEWEMAARGYAPDRRIYPWGDEKPDCGKANFGGIEGCVGDTDIVGRRVEGQSPFGVFDMAGNVWEWVSDWYDSKYYEASPPKNPEGPQWGIYKVLRGGCYDEGPESIRVSCRANSFPTTQEVNIGFRCAYDLK